MHPSSEDKPSADILARRWARQLEDAEIARYGVPRNIARARVARLIGASPGTLENLSRNRLKGVREWLYAKLLDAVTAQARRELTVLQHEYETLLALGQGRDDRAAQEVAQSIARLRAVLMEESR